MRVAFFGYDVVQSSPLSHLVAEILMLFDKRFFVVLIMGEKPNLNDPVCKKLFAHFKSTKRFIKNSPKDTSKHIQETASKLKLHVFCDLSGYTHGNHMDVWQTRPAFLHFVWLFVCPTYSLKLLLCWVDLLHLMMVNVAA